MKRLRIYLASLCAAMLALGCMLFAACGEEGAVGGARLLESSETRVVIEGAETKGSLFDAMSALKGTDGFTFEGSEGQWGFYIESMNGKAVGSNEYWAIYTTLGEYDGVTYSSSDTTYDYNGKTCLYAQYGCSGLPLVQGNLYVLVLETF